MKYVYTYESPLGTMVMAGTRSSLTNLDFKGQLYMPDFGADYTRKDTALFKRVAAWLDEYFLGKKPEPNIPLSLEGTEFRKDVWKILQNIPYGSTTTYGMIAKEIAKERGQNMSAQAVGGAVGHNPVSIIVPCHRVIGSDGSLTGYAGGKAKKRFLLDLEGASYLK